MTFKQGLQKAAEWFVGSLFTLGVGMLLLYKTDAIASKKEAKKELERKADIEYVDKADAAIVKNMDEFKEDQKELHETQYNHIQDQLDIVVEWVKSKE